MTKVRNQLWKNHIEGTTQRSALEALGGTKIRHTYIGAVLARNMVTVMANEFKDTIKELVEAKQLDETEGFSLDLVKISMDTAEELSIDTVTESFVLGSALEQVRDLPNEVAQQVMPQIGLIIKGFKEGLDKDATKAAKQIESELDKLVKKYTEYCDEILVS